MLQRLLFALSAGLEAWRTGEPHRAVITVDVETSKAEANLERLRQLTEDTIAKAHQLADVLGDLGDAGDFDVELDDELLAELARDDDDHGPN